MKWEPSWEQLRALNVGLLLFAVAIGVATDDPITRAIDAFLAGTSVASMFYQTMMIRSRDHFRELTEAFQQMTEAAKQMTALNEALVAGRVKFMMENGLTTMDCSDEGPRHLH